MTFQDVYFSQLIQSTNVLLWFPLAEGQMGSLDASDDKAWEKAKAKDCKWVIGMEWSEDASDSVWHELCLTQTMWNTSTWTQGVAKVIRFHPLLSCCWHYSLLDYDHNCSLNITFSFLLWTIWTGLCDSFLQMQTVRRLCEVRLMCSICSVGGCYALWILCVNVSTSFSTLGNRYHILHYKRSRWTLCSVHQCSVYTGHTWQCLARSVVWLWGMLFY